MNLNFFYSLLKDVVSHFQWKEEDMLVEFTWPSTSGLADELRKQGYELSWAKPERVFAVCQEGAEIYHHKDTKKRVRYRMVNKEGSVLLKKRVINRTDDCSL